MEKQLKYYAVKQLENDGWTYSAIFRDKKLAFKYRDFVDSFESKSFPFVASKVVRISDNLAGFLVNMCGYDIR